MYCLDCGNELGPVDDDPNGRENCICMQCLAETNHDHDFDPAVEFDRLGRQRQQTKSDHIRRFLYRDINTPTSTIIGRLREQNINVTANLIGVVGHSLRSGNRKSSDRTNWRYFGAHEQAKWNPERGHENLTIADLLIVKDVVDKVGGIDAARELVDALEFIIE